MDFQRYTERANALGRRAQDELERIPGAGAVLESFQTEQRAGAPLLAGGLAYRLFFWTVAFGLVLAAAASFWVRADPGGAESTAKSLGLAGVAAHSATTAIQSGSHDRWYFLIVGLGLVVYFGTGAVRALRVTAFLAWQIEPARMRGAIRASLFFSLFLVAASATGLAAGWVRDHSQNLGLVATVGSGAVFVVLALLAFELLPHVPVPSRRAFLPGAVEMAIGLTVMHVVVVYYLGPKLERSPALYGSLGASTVVLLWLFLLGRLTVSALFLNATVERRKHRSGKELVWRTTRPAAIVALGLFAWALAAGIASAVQHFPRGLSVLACLVGAALAAGWAAARSGRARVAGFVAAGLLFAVAIVRVASEGQVGGDLVILGAMALGLVAARHAFATRAQLPVAPRPHRPVLFYNPKSGGGKAERLQVAEEARKRGIEPRELRPGDDLRELVRQAIADGADGLAMAGGDGSQAIVAEEAAAHDLPFACIPAGTRNHFALDLGVDREDVVGALDAFVDGHERVVDLAEVNGRVFVNNVSLGFYAEAVQEAGYREAKIRTLVARAPQALAAREAAANGFSWTSPDGDERSGAAVMLVSNDRYRLGPALGAGTRPRLNAGVLGIAAIHVRDARLRPARIEEWTTAAFEVRADEPLPAAIDGEAVVLDSPVKFRSRPAALRVRIAPQHPGASPSAAVPESVWGVAPRLVAIAFGPGAPG